MLLPVFAAIGATVAGAATPEAPVCRRTLRASVVALDQSMWVNRMGATRPGGMVFALSEDVVSTGSDPALAPGQVQLRPQKRPRPIVLRMNVGDCLDVDLQNLLRPTRVNPMQPVTRNASIHVTGLAVREDVTSEGIDAGANPPSGVVPPGGRRTYRLYAAAEGSSLLYSTPGDYNGFATMQVNQGLFGAVNVEPAGSEWYRSQVSEEDLRQAQRGQTTARQPLLDYDAVYPPGHAQAGRPILRMLDAEGRLRHSDLTAIVTGPGRGRLPGGPGQNPILPDRDRPFREVTIHYHEAQDVIQAFPQIYALDKTLSIPDAGYDGFAINYGTAGIAAEILSNRLGVGPAAGCAECKFEEFFLSSWALGDPGLLVDVPANFPCTPVQLQCMLNKGPNCGSCTPTGEPKATKAFFPDDPSNVYHSYVGDRARFRVLHAGSSVHHVHHHHAHQWLFSAEEAGSNYLDSQSIGPGSSFTAELVYEGSGNRNLTVGDSIFHCHFYPHFASGMWALFRVHDVFEAGTPLDQSGRPRAGSRALPDGEIATGTPIPAVVPIPTTPMPPMPTQVAIVNGQVQIADGDGFPGYPFYVPGIAGHRPPHPPFDFAVDPQTKATHDGGLPRHLVTAGVVGNNQFTPLDWSKDLTSIDAFRLPEDGTATERRAIRYFSRRRHPSFTPENQAMDFAVNGLPRGPQPGAPYADPAVVAGRPVGNPKRIYKGVNLQLDSVFNKVGWHFPQQRIMSLWEDVPAFVSGKKPPEPLFFRATENDVIEYWHTNLVPSYYELDDFQVRTPTDILGQHIHLVKFDVTSSDGAANGFNYEDGTFGPEEVRERIEGINAQGGLRAAAGSDRRTRLRAKGIPQLGPGPGGSWLGAQATVQRWWVDPLAAPKGTTKMTDRTFMTVFTHDHFGPSTHQMVGLYGGLLVEPAGTRWTSPDGRTRYGTRADGGPTGYAANVLYLDPARSRDNYREFALEWGDTQSVYGPRSRHRPDCYSYTFEGRTHAQAPPLFDCQPVAPGQAYRGWADPQNVINCINCQQSPSGGPNPPAPSLINVFGSGMIAMNYRNESLALRTLKPPSGVNPKAAAEAGDLAFSLRSIERFDPAFSRQPAPGAPIDPGCAAPDCFRFPARPIAAAMGPLDPYTPLLHAYAGDNVQVRLLVGSHTSMHDFALNGLRWKWEPFDADSGYKSSQFILLSEHFEALFKIPHLGASGSSDYLYNPGASYEGLINGNFGLLRTWSPARRQPFLAPLRPARPPAARLQAPAGLGNDCEKASPCWREFEVHAMTAQKAFPAAAAGGLVYNARGVNLGGGRFDAAHPLVDPMALVYVLVSANGRPVPRPASPEPLVLRAAAGDWIRLRLVNTFTGQEPVFTTPEAANRWSQIPYAFPYGNVPITTSSHVGLHAQLLEYDVARSDGMNVGANAAAQTARPGDAVEYVWYAGTLDGGAATPVEFGAVNLMPADPVMQVYRGLFGALVVEPTGAQWIEDPHTRTSATVWSPRDTFREQVLMVQNDMNVLVNGISTYSAGGGALTGFNYRSEPAFLRYGTLLDAALGPQAPANWQALSAADVHNVIGVNFNLVDTTAMASNALVGGDPQTPVFGAPAGMPVRFRLLSPGGIGDNQQTFELTGHVWQKEPWTDGSTRIGLNPGSEWTGTQTGFGPPTTYEVVLEDAPDGRGGAAGGRFHVPGDYLYRSWVSAMFQTGGWGLFRVAPAGTPLTSFPDTLGVLAVTKVGGGFEVSGYATPSPVSRSYASWVQVTGPGFDARAEVHDGLWKVVGTGEIPATLSVRSAAGGLVSWAAPAGVGAEAALRAGAARAIERTEADASGPGRPHRRWRRQ